VDVDRKAMLRAYKETPLPPGIFAVRNLVSGAVLLGATKNLKGMLNRQRFDLENGTHPNKVLQRDFSELGAESFAFQVLDALEPSDDPTTDLAEELATLESMWRDRLAAEGVEDYGPAARVL
jgi:hypothetical protein